MDYPISIETARVTSLHDVLDDDGTPMRWTRRRWARADAQIAMGESFEIRVGGVLAAIGGFVPDGRFQTQVWMFAGPALADRGRIRAGLDAMCAVLDVAADRHRGLYCLVRADLPKARKLSRLCGWIFTAAPVNGWLMAVRSPEPALSLQEMAA